jgi:hypothetical protein
MIKGMDDDNPYKSPTSAPEPPKRDPRNRWRRIISSTIFATVGLTSTAWTWYADKFVIAVLCLLMAALIRWLPPLKKGRSFRLTRYPRDS